MHLRTHGFENVGYGFSHHQILLPLASWPKITSRSPSRSISKASPPASGFKGVSSMTFISQPLPLCLYQTTDGVFVRSVTTKSLIPLLSMSATTHAVCWSPLFGPGSVLRCHATSAHNTSDQRSEIKNRYNDVTDLSLPPKVLLRFLVESLFRSEEH